MIETDASNKLRLIWDSQGEFRASFTGSIGLIPLDGRPICYDFPLLLAQMAGISVLCPPKRILGNLKDPADLTHLHHWLVEASEHTVTVIASLDMLAYGGLIPSRLGTEPLALLQERAARTLELFTGQAVLGFSSILRIPHYNNAEEEPAYWARYGVWLSEYSAALHELGPQAPRQDSIPQEVVDDFLGRRQRNFALNQHWLDQLTTGQLTTVTFCQDDTGPTGLNVQEAHQLAARIDEESLAPLAWVQTGADELAQTLLCRYALSTLADRPKIYVQPTSPTAYSLMTARFDGIPIEQVVHQRLDACGASLCSSMEEADLIWLVHTPMATLQGDYCINIRSDSRATQASFAVECVQQARKLGKPVIIGDVAYANGSDPLLMKALLSQTTDPLDWLYGYGGWNTPGNALGSALAMGLLRYTAERKNSYYPNAFARALSIRLLDDWAYQAEVRRQLRMISPGLPYGPQLPAAMAPWEDRIGSWLRWRPNPRWNFTYPCNRYFEIGIS